MPHEPRKPGRHFLQIPGPTPLPERVVQAMARQVLDHRGPEFQKLGLRVLGAIKTVFRTKNPVVIYPSSGTGAWEAGFANTLSPGDKVLMTETGQFAVLWRILAERMGLKVEEIATDWRSAADPDEIESRLRNDKAHAIKAVCAVHSETSTGSLSSIPDIRRAIDAAGHPALFMVDTISGLAAADYRHDDWGVDVSVCASQKGLMTPPGLSFTALSDKAIAAGKTSTLPKGYWSWGDMLPMIANGVFPYTPATTLLYALEEAITLIHEEGLDEVIARHARLAEATRRAVRGWGLEVLVRDPKHQSPTVTAVLMPDGHNADAFRKTVLDSFNMSLGTGLGRVAGKVFRIGHLGDTNELTIMGALSGVEMGLELAGVPHKKGGAVAAMEFLVNEMAPPRAQAA